MRIDDLFAARGEEPVFSFEFFPPKTPEGERKLAEALGVLGPLEPDFVSVTWGAGGSTRDKTIDIVEMARADHDLETMAHFTCVGLTVEEIHAALRDMEARGIENVLTLRGDPPQGEERFVAVDGGLTHASELAGLVDRHYDFCIVAACYPEVHQECASMASDLAHLRAKVDAGARVLITQLFFDNADYFHFVEEARAAGIEVPIVPGIMPISSADQLRRFTALCGARIPAALDAELDRREGDPAAVHELGIAYATQQCAELLAGGAPGVHFYTINRPEPVRAILSALRLGQPWRGAGGRLPERIAR